MKNLTLELWDKVIDAFFEKTLNNSNIIGTPSKDQVANYLGFYGVHNSLYWSEQEGKICGVATAHPGNKDLDWNWGEENGIWTTHAVWAENKKALSDVLHQFLTTKQPAEFYAWRTSKTVPLPFEKLRRLLSYGK